MMIDLERGVIVFKAFGRRILPGLRNAVIFCHKHCAIVPLCQIENEE